MTERVFETPKGTIHYWINAFVPGRQALVFLPGLTADHRLFDRQTEFFEPKYNLLVWDAPGHGASRPFELDFTLADKADWLAEILRTEGITAPVLIGQSMGGYVSQCYMDRFPGTVGGFISIDSAPLKRKYMTAAELWLLKRMEPVYRAYPWEALKRSGSKGCAETPEGRALMKAMMEPYTGKEYSKLAGHGFRILAEAIEADRPYVIDCPALLLCGEHDRAGSAKSYNRRWSKEEGLPLTWIENAGHNSNTDAPRRVNTIIQNFVEETVRGGKCVK